MGKLKYLPTGNELELLMKRASEIARFLISEQAGREPGAILLTAPHLLGLSPDDEQRASFGMFHAMSDRNTDSISWLAKMVYDWAHNGFSLILDWPTVNEEPEFQTEMEEDPFDPNCFVEVTHPVFRPSHYDETADYLSRLSHPFAGQVASHWIRSYNVLQRDHGGSVLELVSSPTHTTYRKLRDDYPGMGPKTTPLFMSRLWRSGLARHFDMQEIGIAVDRHVLAQTLGWDLLPGVKSTANADSVVNAANRLWQLTCQKYDLDPVRLHEAMWLLGRNRCRWIKCDECPLWSGRGKKGACRGRVSLASYNGDGARKIDPNRIMPVGGQTPPDLALTEHEVSPPPGPHETLVQILLGGAQPTLPF